MEKATFIIEGAGYNDYSVLNGWVDGAAIVGDYIKAAIEHEESKSNNWIVRRLSMKKDGRSICYYLAYNEGKAVLTVTVEASKLRIWSIKIHTKRDAEKYGLKYSYKKA